MAEGFVNDENWEAEIVGPTKYKYDVSRTGPYKIHSPHILGRWVLTGFKPVDNVATRYKTFQ